jgi:hypothetical protein
VDSSANGLCGIGLSVLGLAECTVATELAAMTQYELAKHMNVLVIINREERTQALLDSGVMGNFIHPHYVQEWSLITMK